MLFTQSIKNLTAGISQQPDYMKYPEQLSHQVNGLSSETKGLLKRPPTLNLLNIEDKGNPDASVFHLIDRDDNEKYGVVLEGDQLRVFDLLSKEEVVVNNNAPNYLESVKNKNDIRFVTVADTTFVLNKKVKTRLLDILAPDAWEKQGLLVNVKSGDYGCQFKVAINGEVIGSFLTPDGAKPTHVNDIRPDVIRRALFPNAQTTYTFSLDTLEEEMLLKMNAVSYPAYTQKLKPLFIPLLQGTGLTFDDFATMAHRFVNKVFIENYIKLAKQEPPTDVNIRKVFLDKIGTSGKIDLTGLKNKLNPLFNTYPMIDKNFMLSLFVFMQATTDQTEDYYRVGVIRDKLNAFFNVLYTKVEVANKNLSVFMESPLGTIYNSSVYSYIIPKSFPLTSYEGADGQAGKGMYLIHKSVTDFTHLPSQAPAGFTVEIKPSKGDTAYYVRYNADENAWEETVRPGLLNMIDPASMPHALVREADGTFTFKELEWEYRKVGDDKINEVASFIGESLNDIFFFRNRLGFIGGENIVLSRSGDYFNFWVETTTTMKDTDPIDISVSHNKISILENAIPFNESLYLFSKTTQFVLQTEGVLAAKTAKVDQVTEYDNYSKVHPVGAGNNLYFINERNNFSAVQEYHVVDNGQTQTLQADEITLHIQKYIPNGAYKIATCNNENMFLVLTEGVPHKCYVYKYLILGNDKVQSSWSEWDFGADVKIIGADSIGSTFYFLMKRSDTYTIEEMGISNYTTVEDNEPYLTYMDNKIPFTGDEDMFHYDLTTDTTKIDLAHIPNVEQGRHIVSFKSGKYVVLDDEFKGEIDGDMTLESGVHGVLYPFRCVLSKFLPKLKTETGVDVVAHKSLILQTFFVNYIDSGTFEIITYQSDKLNYSDIITTRLLGTTTGELNIFPIQTGEAVVPVFNRGLETTAEIFAFNPLPLCLNGAGWNFRLSINYKELK